MDTTKKMPESGYKYETIDDLTILNFIAESGHQVTRLKLKVFMCSKSEDFAIPGFLNKTLKLLKNHNFINFDGRLENHTLIFLTAKGLYYLSEAQQYTELKIVDAVKFQTICKGEGCTEILTQENTVYNKLLHETNVCCFMCGHAEAIKVKLLNLN